MRGTMAVFLAGGRGEGLGVLSEHRAPAAVPFAGKYRLVDFSLSNCHHSEVFHVALLTQHAPTSLNEHIRAGRPWDLNRDSGGVRTLHPFAWRQRAAWYEGPTDALLRNLNEYEELGAQRVVVGSAEHVYLMDYSQLVQSHLEARCPMTAAVTPAVPARAWRARGIEVRGERVRSLVPRRERGGPEGDGRAARPAASPSFEAMGVFVFEMDFLRTLSADTLPRTLYDLTASMLGHGVPVHAYGFDGFWEDLDDLATYYRTSMALLTPEPALVLDDPVWPVQTRGEERPPARFLPGSSARASLVAGGATVAGEVECSILFGGVVVEPGARVTNSILFQDVRVRQGAVLDRAILDKQVEVGEGAVVGDGPRPADDVAGLCVVGKEASLAPGYRVPRGGVVPVAAGALAGARA